MANQARDTRLANNARGFDQVVGRGRGNLIMRHGSNPNRFCFDTAAGLQKWHFGQGPYTEASEVDTDWIASGPGWVMNKADYSASLQGNTYSFAKDGESLNLTVTDVPQWVNGANQRQTAASLNAANPTPSGDVITYPNLLGTGGNLASLSIQLQPTRLSKVLTVPNVAVWATTSLSGTIELALNFRMQRSNGLAIYVDGVLWNEASNNPKTTASNVEFRKNGVTLFVFRVPFAYDSNNSIVTGRMHLRKTGANLIAEVRIPRSWLMSAVYPVFIDPTVDEQVGAGADDGFEESKKGEGNGTMDNSSTHMRTNLPGAYRTALARFLTVTIPASATINSNTYSQLLAFDSTGDDFNCDIFGEDTSTPATLTTTAGNITTRTYTTASVLWENTGAGSGWYSTPSLSSVIQELVNSYDYSSGTLNLALIYEGNLANTGYCRTYENSSANAPKLHIDYTAAASSKAMPPFQKHTMYNWRKRA